LDSSSLYGNSELWHREIVARPKGALSIDPRRGSDKMLNARSIGFLLLAVRAGHKRNRFQRNPAVCRSPI